MVWSGISPGPQHVVHDGSGTAYNTSYLVLNITVYIPEMQDEIAITIIIPHNPHWHTYFIALTTCIHISVDSVLRSRVILIG